MLPARGVLETQTMKLWHKILWAVAGVIPFVLWGSAFMCSDYTWAFNLIVFSNWWLIIYSAAQLIILFMLGKKKYGFRKTLLASCALIAGYLTQILFLYPCIVFGYKFVRCSRMALI